MILLVFGPQGSGKSTQGKLLAHELGLRFVSVGDILRDGFNNKERLCVKAHEYWKDGYLVPDDLLQEILVRYFKKHKDPNGYVIDGFPRNLNQYDWMDKILPEDVTAVIQLKLAKTEIMRRLNKRKRIEKREDETKEAIKVRLRTYDRETKPLLARFEKDDTRVISVDATKTIEDIRIAVLTKLIEGQDE